MLYSESKTDIKIRWWLDIRHQNTNQLGEYSKFRNYRLADSREVWTVRYCGLRTDISAFPDLEPSAPTHPATVTGGSNTRHRTFLFSLKPGTGHSSPLSLPTLAVASVCRSGERGRSDVWTHCRLTEAHAHVDPFR